MTEPERLTFELEARETILRLALEEALKLYGATLGKQAPDTLFRLEHGFVSSIRDAPAPEHLIEASTAAANDAIALIREAFDGAHQRLGIGEADAPRPQVA